MNDDHREILYYARGSSELVKEVILGERGIRWAYQTKGGYFLSSLFFRSALLSRLYGAYLDSGFSKRKIRPTIKELSIDETEFLEPIDSFASFNAFFIRKLKSEARPFDPDPKILSAPADGRYTVYRQITRDTVYPVKGSNYSIDDLLAKQSEDFYNGSLAVIRLCPADYHRFHFPCDGQIHETKSIAGHYHSVNPIALSLNINIFCDNKRCYTIFQNANFGKIAFVEVGAFGVGSIVQTYEGTAIKKMQEKGYFEFGGSTIIMIIQGGNFAFSADLAKNSEDGYETLVKVGETIGSTVKYSASP